MANKKGNAPYILFLILAFAICLVPSVGTLIRPTTETTENRAMSPEPTLYTDDGTVNLEVFDEFNEWFTDHMAFRNEMVYADTRIQTLLFADSPVSGVVYGTDGWLYYSATLDDYLGANTMSERELYNLAHNFALIQQWLDARGITFLLTIPPNKNTLYPEHMPAWYRGTPDDHDAERLAAYLDELGVEYLDLFALFAGQDEELYLKRDSHWNAKGAVLVYEAIMARLGAEYASVSATVPGTREVIGDLNRMLYSFYGEPEIDYDYGIKQRYRFSKEDATVEDGMLVATTPFSDNGRLLMFRDSFANTLIPLMANDFSQSIWSKGQPNALERYVTMYGPRYVVIEQVERNIRQYLDEPPVIGAPAVTLDDLAKPMRQREVRMSIGTCAYDTTFLQISGEIVDGDLAVDADIYVSVNGTLYCAYQTGEAGFVLYLKADSVAVEGLQISVFATQ